MKKRYAFFLPFASLLVIPALFAQTLTAGGQPEEVKVKDAPVVAQVKDAELKTVELNLIPEPKEVRLQQGGFRVRPTTRILVEFGHQEEDRIAAETLAEEIHDQSGLKLSITGSKEKARQVRSAIVLARLQDRS